MWATWRFLNSKRGAPFDAEEYGLYAGTDEVGQTFTIIGYGLSGTGATGPTIASGTKRMAMNEVAQTVGGGLQLRADFDDGVTDVLGDGLGLGAAEGMERARRLRWVRDAYREHGDGYQFLRHQRQRGSQT